MESFTPQIQSTIIESVPLDAVNANLFKNVILPPPTEEKLASYLRIRPIPGLANSPFTVHGKHLIAKAPPSSKAYKNRKEGESGERTYVFNHIFSEDSTQEEFYHGTALPLVNRCLKGESSLREYI